MQGEQSSYAHMYISHKNMGKFPVTWVMNVNSELNEPTKYNEYEQ